MKVKFHKRSFLESLGSVFDIFACSPPYTITSKPSFVIPVNDEAAIRKDWEKIGMDLSAAIVQFEMTHDIRSKNTTK